MTKIKYRRKGIPKRLNRIPGGVPGLVTACDIIFAKDAPRAKVAIFRNRAAMRQFYHKTLPRYRNAVGISDRIDGRCSGLVSKLEILSEKYDASGNTVEECIERDRRYFCIVLLAERYLTAEILAHEAVHVGFAWDRRTAGESKYSDPDNAEENVCYPAGIFLNEVLSFIKSEGLREV